MELSSSSELQDCSVRKPREGGSWPAHGHTDLEKQHWVGCWDSGSLAPGSSPSGQEVVGVKGPGLAGQPWVLVACQPLYKG